MEVVELPLNKIVPSVFQPRETFPKDELQELADSMKEHGLLNPISVRKNGDGTYQIIAGERRWRAAKFAGMKNIYAFVKEITNEQQRIESLIENVHRKDLNMIEKGRGMMEIFKIHEIDIKPREISLIIKKRRYNRPMIGQEEKIVNVLSKIHTNPRNVELWLESISADEEVIEDHLKTPEKERIPDSTIARVATIEDKDLQKKTYAKIKKQDMGQKQASTFVTGIKKLVKDKPKLAEMVLESDLPLEVAEVIPEEEITIDIPEEELQEIVQKIEDKKKKAEEIKAQPVVQERYAHNENHTKLSVILNLSQRVFCPYCAKDGSHIRFDCHPDKSFPEVVEQASANFVDATRREEVDPRFKDIVKKVGKNGLQKT